jgi:membrane-bound lytic murein transglycosylase D
MFLCRKNIYFLTALLFSFPFYCQQITEKDHEQIISMCSHANKLVRENKYETALYFYDSIFEYIDSIESEKSEVSAGSLDSLKDIVNNHYSNFEKLVTELDIELNSEDNIFCFEKKDFNLTLEDTSDLGYKSFEVVINKKQVQKWLDFYTEKSRTSTQIYLERAFDYIDDMKKIFKHFGLPEELSFIPLAESGFSPFAHSFQKAIGLWQFIPSTGKIFGLNINWWEDDRKNVIKSTIAAAKYYRYLYSKLGDWNLAIAGYNCGHVRIEKSIKKHKTNNFWKMYSLPKETKEYIPRVNALISIGQDPTKYGFFIEKEKTRHDTVMLDSCVNLNVIALSAGISYEDLKRLNPHLRQWCIPPYSKNYPVVIPAMSKIRFRENMSGFSRDEIYPVTTYIVKKGDSVQKIAEMFKVDESAVNDLNNVRNKKLNQGQKIKVLVPPTDKEWFNDFNKKYITYNDGEEYYKGGKKKISYKIKTGDTLSSISKKHKVNITKLKAWNKLGKKDTIVAGKNLVIYL